MFWIQTNRPFHKYPDIFLGYLKVSEIFRLGVFRNIHSLFTCPRVVLAISVLCQKQSNSAISHSKNVSHVSESAKTAIFQSNGTWKCLDLPQFRPLHTKISKSFPQVIQHRCILTARIRDRKRSFKIFRDIFFDNYKIFWEFPEMNLSDFSTWYLWKGLQPSLCLKAICD